MALQVEDNTGLANAESYVSAATFRAYVAARGGSDAVDDLSDDEVEGKLRAAFTYINNEWVWKSIPLNNDQAGEFPRQDLSDGMGRIYNVVPQRVKDAQCEAAWQLALGVDLFTVADRGGQVASEAVGPISTSYFQGAPAETYFQVLNRLLCVFARDPNNPYKPLPSFNDPATDPVFSVGMDDNPGQC